MGIINTTRKTDLFLQEIQKSVDKAGADMVSYLSAEGQTKADSDAKHL
jgi:hypothetical protein